MHDILFQILDLSGLKFSTLGITNLARGLSSIPHALTVLNLKGTLGSPKGAIIIYVYGYNATGASAIIQALQENPGLGLSIQELNLSQNKFDLDTSNQLTNWLQDIHKASALKRIAVAECTGLNIGNETKLSKKKLIVFRSIPYLKAGS